MLYISTVRMPLSLHSFN